MSYISDYKHGGDQFEYEQCCAEENNRDRIDQEEEWNERNVAVNVNTFIP